MGTLLVLNGVYLIFNIPFQISNALIFVGITPVFEAMSLVSYQDLNRLFSFNTYGSPPGMSEGMFVVSGLFSLIVYGLGAAALIYNSLVSFDGLLDRPSSPTDRFARPGKLVRFIDDFGGEPTESMNEADAEPVEGSGSPP